MNLITESFGLYKVISDLSNFDSLSTVTHATARWATWGNISNSVNSLVAGRFDSKALQCNGSNNIFGGIYLGGSFATLFAGMAYKANSINGNTIIFGFADSSSPLTAQGTLQVEIRIQTDGTLTASRNGTLLGSSTLTVSVNTWFYLELSAVIHPSAGSVTVKVNGITYISLSGVNTRATANSSANILYVGSNFMGSIVDDIYVNDNSGTTNNTFLGDVKIIGGNPASNGSLQDFSQNTATWTASTVTVLGTTILDSNNNIQRCTANTGDAKTGASAPTWSTTLNATTTDNHVTWTCLGSQAAYKLVNETWGDADSSYLSSTTLNAQSTFGCGLSLSGSSVLGVVVYGTVRKDDSGARSIRLITKSGSTVGDNGADLALSPTYQQFRTSFDKNPATSAAWTVSDAAAAEIGVKITV